MERNLNLLLVWWAQKLHRKRPPNTTQQNRNRSLQEGTFSFVSNSLLTLCSTSACSHSRQTWENFPFFYWYFRFFWNLFAICCYLMFQYEQIFFVGSVVFSPRGRRSSTSGSDNRQTTTARHSRKSSMSITMISSVRSCYFPIEIKKAHKLFCFNSNQRSFFRLFYPRHRHKWEWPSFTFKNRKISKWRRYEGFSESEVGLDFNYCSCFYFSFRIIVSSIISDRGIDIVVFGTS